MMDSKTVKAIVDREAAQIESNEPFVSFHGLGTVNFRSFLVEPYAIQVRPDDDRPLRRYQR